MKRLFLIGSAILFSAGVNAQAIVLQNARVLTATTPDVLENASVVIHNGKITAVGAAVSVPAGAQIIDLSGKTITPGFVVADTLLGVTEISGGANATETASRKTDISAGYDVQYAINPYSTAIAVARKGGVSRAVVLPSGASTAAFAGQAAILTLNGSLPADVTPKVAVIWDVRANTFGRGAAFVQLQAELADVRKYARSKSALTKGELLARDWSVADLEALVPIVEGKTPLAVRVDRAADIAHLISFSQQQKIKLILIGVAEGWQLAEQIAKAGIPVIVDPTDNLPGNFDAIGATSDNAARLHQAGVRLIIKGGSSAHDAGKLRYFAGMVVARGVPYQAALQAITVNPASIWGAKDTGTVAAGQSADLAVWSGDPFEPLTELTALYIKGQPQLLQSRQDQLEDKYIRALQATITAQEN